MPDFALGRLEACSPRSVVASSVPGACLWASPRIGRARTPPVNPGSDHAG